MQYITINKLYSPFEAIKALTAKLGYEPSLDTITTGIQIEDTHIVLYESDKEFAFVNHENHALDNGKEVDEHIYELLNGDINAWLKAKNIDLAAIKRD